MKRTMVEYNSSTEPFFKRLKSESFSPLIDEELDKKIRKNLEHYYTSDNNPGEWLFLEIDFFNLRLLQVPPRFEDFKALLLNEIYKKSEVNSGNFLLKLLLDKTTEPAIIVRLLQDNGNYGNISLSDDEITFITDYLKGKDMNFIVLLVQHIDSLVEKTVDSERFFLEMLTKHLKALEKIPALKQHIKNELLEKDHGYKDFLKEIKENVTKSLKILQYWEIEIKSQIIHSIQTFLARGVVESFLPMEPIPEVTNGPHFFQPKPADRLVQAQQQPGGSYDSAYTYSYLS